jgi:hypothetical protein
MHDTRFSKSNATVISLKVSRLIVGKSQVWRIATAGCRMTHHIPVKLKFSVSG